MQLGKALAIGAPLAIAALVAFKAAGVADAEPAVAQSYLTPAERAEPKPAPQHRWVMRKGAAFGYAPALSANDINAGLATRALVMVDFNGMVQGDYSFTTYNPITGNAIIMRCAEPCAFMNVMNYDHRVPEVFPVTPGSVMEAIVLDARAGLLNR
jgi:hypothetical protein